MPIVRQTPDASMFNRDAELPYMLRLEDFGLVMQDVYDFFFDVNTHLSGRGLKRLDDMLRPAAMSGLVSDMIAASMARYSRVLVENRYHNGHPDLIVNGVNLFSKLKRDEMIRQGRQEELEQIGKHARESQTSIRDKAADLKGKRHHRSESC